MHLTIRAYIQMTSSATYAGCMCQKIKRVPRLSTNVSGLEFFFFFTKITNVWEVVRNFCQTHPLVWQGGAPYANHSVKTYKLLEN